MRPVYPFEAPAYGEAIEIAPAIFWARIPLPMALDHINIYWLVDDDGVTIIDTGLNTKIIKDHWLNLVAKYIAPLSIKRVLLTHYHPDHAGLIGWFMREYGAELLTTRTTYLLTRMLLLDVQERPSEHHKRYWQRAGYDATWIENRMDSRPFNFIDTVEMIPLGFRGIHENEVIHLAGRDWKIRFGQGHAPDQITLWSDEFVIIGDQCLPAITPVISVFPTEPSADPLKEFTQSCAQMAEFANDNQLFLCGHNRPFFGGKSRLQALANHHYETLIALRAALESPKTMIETYGVLFKRPITSQNEGFAISEATAHFNHLEFMGEIEMITSDDGLVRYQLRQSGA